MKHAIAAEWIFWILFMLPVLAALLQVQRGDVVVNRKARRARAAQQSRTPRHVVEQAEKDGYVLFEVSDEGWEKLKIVLERMITDLDESSVADGFFVLTRLSAAIAACGFRSKIDEQVSMSRDAFLKNCAKQYDGFIERRSRLSPTINTKGGSA